MAKYKIIMKCVCFWVIGILLFCIIQEILVASYTDNIDKTIQTMYKLPDNEVQVVFAGTSVVELGISPLTIYDTNKIRTYNIGTSAQPIEGTFFLLQEFFENQNPEIVVVDASGLYNNSAGAAGLTELANWRYIIDNMKIGAAKIGLVKEYAKLNTLDGVGSTLFPIILYHERWGELDIRDFRQSNNLYYSLGNYIITITTASTENVDSINAMVELYKEKEMAVLHYRENGGETITESIDGLWYNPEMYEESKQYFYKIKELCEENGAELILTKVPTNVPYSTNRASWTYDKYERVSKFADELGVQYIDFVYGLSDFSLDWSSDSFDGGLHLNVKGAERLSQYWANYLSQYIVGSESVTYENVLMQYKKAQQVIQLQTINSLEEYLQYLIDSSDKYEIYICVKSDFFGGLTEKEKELLHELGLSVFEEAEQREGYIACIDQGNVLYEATANRRHSKQLMLEGKTVALTSAGYLMSSCANIVIDGTDYSLNIPGMNFVVIDKSTNLVVDSSCCNVMLGNHAIIRDVSKCNQYYRDYELNTLF